MRNVTIKLDRIYVCYTNITLYHVMYSFRYYQRFNVTAVGLGTHYPWIRGFVCIPLPHIQATNQRNDNNIMFLYLKIPPHYTCYVAWNDSLTVLATTGSVMNHFVLA